MRRVRRRVSSTTDSVTYGAQADPSARAARPSASTMWTRRLPGRMSASTGSPLAVIAAAPASPGRASGRSYRSTVTCDGASDSSGMCRWAAASAMLLCAMGGEWSSRANLVRGPSKRGLRGRRGSALPPVFRPGDTHSHTAVIRNIFSIDGGRRARGADATRWAAAAPAAGARGGGGGARGGGGVHAQLRRRRGDAALGEQGRPIPQPTGDIPLLLAALLHDEAGL